MEEPLIHHRAFACVRMCLCEPRRPEMLGWEPTGKCAPVKPEKIYNK